MSTAETRIGETMTIDEWIDSLLERYKHDPYKYAAVLGHVRGTLQSACIVGGPLELPSVCAADKITLVCRHGEDTE